MQPERFCCVGEARGERVKQFKIGDHVTWVHTGRTKTGCVEVIVPPYTNPEDIGVRISSSVSCVLTKTHESYVIRARCNGKDKLYWPRVNGLRLAE